jgi:diguanylate cyclase (GGDEF)-like protein
MNPTYPVQDELTRLNNRKTFNEHFAVLMAEVHLDETPLSLALFDCDRFLQFNERYGHSGGDRLLQSIADIIREIAGHDVIASRYGGDEFALLFHKQEREQAFLCVERIRAAIENLSISVDGDEPITGATISGGIASFPIDGRTQAELIRKADQALYRAKKITRNSIRLAYEERMVTKTTHYTQTQLERLAKLAEERSLGEAELLREALDDLLTKYGLTDIER